MDSFSICVSSHWDAWEVRMLVLLSFVIQVILSVFGSWRKYIRCVWFNSLLFWSAYLMADGVANVAMGKLSNAKSDKGNDGELWAIWTSLFLLHLGEPDGITAYSLVDNQLWMRHSMAFCGQTLLAIYVIVMSWKNSRFSFMALLAFVAGFAKYGERTWVLMLASEGKYIENIPINIDVLSAKYSTGDGYVHVLVMARKHLKEFMTYLKSGVYGEFSYDVSSEDERISTKDAVDVMMGLMYDLVYSKATHLYSKLGWFLRGISFLCMVALLVGLIIQIAHFNLREEYDMIDIAITLALVGGALLLEIYAAIEIFSSNWMMLWLIKQGRGELVKYLRERFPRLFKKKNWSNKMGQFDLNDYWKEEERRCCSNKMGHLVKDYEAKWTKYRHTTECSVNQRLYDAILQFCYGSRALFHSSDEVMKIWNILGEPHDSLSSFLGPVKWLHLATKELYEEHPRAINYSKLDDSDMDDSKALSNYMMYLLVMHPSLFPIIEPPHIVEEKLFPRIKPKASNEASPSGSKEGSHINDHEVDEIVKSLKKMHDKPRMWQTIKVTWLRMLLTASSASTDGRKNSHFQQLTKGGELLTFIWFANPKAGLN